MSNPFVIETVHRTDTFVMSVTPANKFRDDSPGSKSPSTGPTLSCLRHALLLPCAGGIRVLLIGRHMWKIAGERVELEQERTQTVEAPAS